MSLVVSSSHCGPGFLWLPLEIWEILLRLCVLSSTDPVWPRNKAVFQSYGRIARVCSLFNYVCRSFSFYQTMMNSCGYEPSWQTWPLSRASGLFFGDTAGFCFRMSWVDPKEAHDFGKQTGPALFVQDTGRFSMSFTRPCGYRGFNKETGDVVTVDEKGKLLGVYKKPKRRTSHWKPVHSNKYAARARYLMEAATERTVAQIMEWRKRLCQDMKQNSYGQPVLYHRLTRLLEE
jgi:hypothetical protein